MTMVGEPLSSVLRSGRDLFNAKFSQAARRFPQLDAARFRTFLTSVVDPVAGRLGLSPDALAGWAQTAYDVGLELAGEGLVGTEGRLGAIESAWIGVLPRLPLALGAAHAVVLPALSNAAHQLSRAKGARVEAWITALADAAPDCTSTAEFLQAGQVLAWRAGMAQYREGALERAMQMRPELTRRLLGIPSAERVDEVLTRLGRDRWYDPADTSGADSRVPLRAVKQLGAFRGFGGDFLQPPRVAAVDDQLFVASGEGCWLLLADVFGHSLHRCAASEQERVRTALERRVLSPVLIEGRHLPVELPGEITGVAVTTHTVAVTSAFTHRVQLIARGA